MVQYDDICNKVKIDYKNYKEEIDNIDMEIKELMDKKANIIEANKRMVALYNASRQFDLEDVVLNEILNTDQRITLPLIEKRFLEITNLNKLTKEMENDIKAILLEAEVEEKISKNSFGYCKKVVFEDLDDDDYPPKKKKGGKPSNFRSSVEMEEEDDD